MAYNVVITNKAEHDLDEIIDYMVNELCNMEAAQNLVDELKKHYDMLSQTPNLFEACPQILLQQSAYRKVVVRGYVLIYRVDEDKSVVYVERFFSELQNFASRL